MIKLIKNFFTDKERVDDSTLEVVVEIPEESIKGQKSKSELFDEAVKDVLVSKISESVKNNLIEMCYSSDVVNDTNNAEKYMNDKDKSTDDALKEFPKANVIYGHMGHRSIGLEFNLSRFVRVIVEEALDD